MSIPNVGGSVRRRSKVDLEYQDRKGAKQFKTFEGFLARVIMHEVDHLNGVLYVDHMAEGESLERVDIF